VTASLVGGIAPGVQPFLAGNRRSATPESDAVVAMSEHQD